MQHLARTLQISLEVTGTHRHLPGLRRRAVSKSRKEEAGFRHYYVPAYSLPADTHG